jgi:fucose permease
MTSARAARSAVGAAFFLNGLLFATWVARIPEARSSLGLDNAQLGLLLLAIAVGSMMAMPASGALIERFDVAGVIRTAAAATLIGLSVVAVAIMAGVTWIAAVALFVYGAGTGVWDVAMNVEGASVERRLERSIMPRFHAAWSLGSVTGAGLGIAAVAVGVPILVHVLPVALGGVIGVVLCSRSYLVIEEEQSESSTSSALSAWREPQTLLIGLMMLALALTEGAANDWLALALVDGHDAERWVGVSGFGVFVAAMTAGRFGGPVLLDRFGRLPMLWGTMVMAGGGVLVIVLASHPALIVAGIILWGLGASLGFPVGISAAADVPSLAAARVSVVSTLGYAAFFAGPPLIGFVADKVGTLHALLVVVAVLVPSALAVPSASKPRRLVA